MSAMCRWPNSTRSGALAVDRQRPLTVITTTLIPYPDGHEPGAGEM